ncbi:MAG: metallophosphoesterase [Dysgonamonadaceae bacterium]|jgi:3',5'-cyclic AMP phosphodiesterase CpdA|nr:metallophosphoesterase [Dysgonamonadaceae bacterium]
MNNPLAYLLVIAFFLTSCGGGKLPERKLTFAFLTDIHQNAGNTDNRRDGFISAVDMAVKSGAQFIITGGDMVDISGMGVNIPKSLADSLYAANKKILDDSGLPYYPAIGNHDRYFNHDEGFDIGDELFESYFGRSYYTFEVSGIKFFVLNSVRFTDNKTYTLGDEQMQWLNSELAATSVDQPLVLSLHVPLYSLYYPVVEGKILDLDVVADFAMIRDAFRGHNLRLVLQGHQHVYEEIFSQNVYYITAGAVSGNWWRGSYHGTEEGFLLVHVDVENAFTWEYVDFGWEKK